MPDIPIQVVVKSSHQKVMNHLFKNNWNLMAKVFDIILRFKSKILLLDRILNRNRLESNWSWSTCMIIIRAHIIQKQKEVIFEIHFQFQKCMAETLGKLKALIPSDVSLAFWLQLKAAGQC